MKKYRMRLILYYEWLYYYFYKMTGYELDDSIVYLRTVTRTQHDDDIIYLRTVYRDGVKVRNQSREPSHQSSSPDPQRAARDRSLTHKKEQANLRARTSGSSSHSRNNVQVSRSINQQPTTRGASTLGNSKKWANVKSWPSFDV